MKKRLTISALTSILVFLFLLILFQPQLALAQQQTSQSESSQPLTQQEKQIVASLKSALEAATVGPSNVALVDQGYIELPEGYIFIPVKEASILMSSIGNRTNDAFIGLIMPKSKDDLFNWFISISFRDLGYVRDDEADSLILNADELLHEIRKNTEDMNKERRAKGIGGLEVLGWNLPPHYDKKSHQITWSMINKADDESENSINYRALALGREGILQFTLVTSESFVARDKSHLQYIIESTHYNKGKRYEDFAQGTDKVATYGLAALVTGIAAKKLGLLALAGAIFIKMWKLILVVPLLLWGVVKKFFGVKNNTSDEVSK